MIQPKDGDPSKFSSTNLSIGIVFLGDLRDTQHLAFPDFLA